MAVPKRRKSKSKVRTKRAHHAIGKPNLAPCPNCNFYRLPHRICPTCGFYKTEVVLEPKVKKPKEEN
ncbi:ribosomal protein L32 [Leptospira weilii serovar Topaz str. LT2116]|uniref:Large ribosomal subunit protein bL32 n=1 Tax=Leptospira weilii serovar Topaz str. LT2116 TaxID=1088540 RepID=M3FVD1_9LEPT|nr:50S ribosomal protein L32 [Leptospira weilii]EMF84232.1 ribosomal protein L32 [Leptospira weilii serovar Topaz str. LT2116]